MTAPMPVITDRLPLTRRAMARYRRWVDADQWTRKGTEQEISAAEVAALDRLRRNLESLDWSQAFNERGQSVISLEPWVTAQILAGLDLAPEAIPDLIRATGIGDGWRQRALEKALAERAAARQQAVCRVTETKQEQTEMTKHARVMEFLRSKGIDPVTAQVPTALKEAAAAACDTTAMTVSSMLTAERARVARQQVRPVVPKPSVTRQEPRESASAPNPVSEEAPAQKPDVEATETPLSGQAAGVSIIRHQLREARREAEALRAEAHSLRAELEQSRQQPADGDLTDEQRKRALQIVMALDAPMSEAVAILRLAAKLAEVAAA